MNILKNITLGQLLDETAQKFPNKDAIVFPDINFRINYENFKLETDKVAKSLIALGVKKGEHIGIFAVNCPEWVILQFSAAKAGAVLVNINPALKTHELKYILDQGDITTIFLTEEFKNQSMVEVLDSLISDKASFTDLPKLKQVITISKKKYGKYLTWNEFISNSSLTSNDVYANRQGEITPQDIVNIQYTSGTTGFPKGAQLKHFGIINNSYYCGINMNLTDKDSMCIPVPLYHCFGCVLGSLTCVNFGIPMVFPSAVFDPEKTLQAVHKEKCTALHGVPTMFIAELSHENFSKYDLNSLRTGVIAGAPCPMELMKQLINKMNLNEITIGYGFTEASPLITQTRFNDSLEIKVGTVGKPMQEVEVKIITTEDKKGELCAKGYNAMEGYYKMPEKTKDTLDADGWMHTGDLATIDENGVYKIVGRIKDMIIRGGENIYPAEIEDFLMTNPNVEQAQVVGVKDEKFGEQVAAAIKLKEGKTWTEDEVKEWCKGKIANFKIPKYVVFVNSYPLTANGKVQKYKLKEELEKVLGL